MGARRRSARFIGHVIARAVLTFEEVITNASNVREKPRCVRLKKKKNEGKSGTQPFLSITFLFLHRQSF